MSEEKIKGVFKMEENTKQLNEENNPGTDESSAHILTTDIIYFGKKVKVTCDNKCEKAWGFNSRPRKELKDGFDYLTDAELGDAPIDPGTYEGGYGKPMHPEKHNKWCVRECERCEWT